MNLERVLIITEYFCYYNTKYKWKEIKYNFVFFIVCSLTQQKNICEKTLIIRGLSAVFINTNKLNNLCYPDTRADKMNIC